MSAPGNRTEEGLVEYLVLDVLGDGRVRENAEVRDALQSWPLWTREDRHASASRKVPKWHASVNNVLSEGRGLYGKNFVESHGEGLHKITHAGLVELERHKTWANLAEEVGLTDDALGLG